MEIDIDYKPNAKQMLFHSCSADEVVYGGAKGGGKSYALVMECLAYCLEHSGAKAYLFRESYDDLEANLIETWRRQVPEALYKYTDTKHIATLINGSQVFFRFVSSYKDALRYQGRSIDFIGIDELTKHEERTVQELLSCLRSPKGFPPVFKGTCNPGGIGHTWVKERYITSTLKGRQRYTDPITGNSIAFIPANVYDNEQIVKNDPAYLRRLENLSPDKKKAYLYGDWDIFEGQYFDEWDESIHISKPFALPAHWRRYMALDYGLDMCACYLVAVDEHDNAYVYKELYRSGLIVTDAIDAIKAMIGGDRMYMCIAPPDLYNRHSDTGKSTAEIFADHGIYLTAASNDRVMGWLNLHEWLKPYMDEQGCRTAHLRIFETCPNLIRTLPALQYDERNPSDVSKDPHELTHAPDAIRYFISARPLPTKIEANPNDEDYMAYDDQVESFLDYGG